MESTNDENKKTDNNSTTNNDNINEIKESKITNEVVTTGGVIQQLNTSDIVKETIADIQNKLDGNDKSNEDKQTENVKTKEEEEIDEGNIINFVVIYSKQKFDIKISENSTILKLKKYLENIVGVPQGLQKIMYKSLAKNEQTLKQVGIGNNTKVMLVGSKLNDLSLVAPPTGSDENSQSEDGKTTKEPMCKQKLHRKILDKGVPDDAMPGILNCQEPLPPFPLSGMVNKSGGKLRITFKLELDELWLGTKERTEKIRMSSIKTIVSEPIEGAEQYHIMALQLGTTEASRYWIYYVPAQYVEAIKDTILDS